GEFQAAGAAADDHDAVRGGRPGHAAAVSVLADRTAATSRQYMCWPPLTDTVEPVTKLARSSTRNITAWAMSSAVPSRPTGIVAMIFSSTLSGTARTMSVST